MRYLTWAGLGLFFVANLAIGGAVGPPPPCSPLYAENGDAGNRFANNPQDVSGGSFCGFSGSIGPDDTNGGPVAAAIDTEDAFRFFFSGGNFTISIVFPAGIGGHEGDLTRELYADLNRNAPLSHIGDSWGVLLAGNYVFELTVVGADPPFTISLQGPTGQTNLISAPIPQQEAPEPGALALMLAGLAGLGALRRRAKAA